jgi:hypothetical protein
MRRFSTAARTSFTLLGALVLLACTSGPALGHVPALEPRSAEGATRIGGPEVSRAIYGYLAPDEEYDAFVFSVDKQVNQAIGIIVPARAEHEGFRPELRVLADGAEIALIADPGLPEREAEWEPFSLTAFWHGTEERLSFEPGVEYELHVEPGDGTETSGRYVIVFGGPEAFTAADSMRTIVYLPVIWFGAYGGAPAHWNWWALVPLGIAGAALVLIGRLLHRAVRRGRAAR